MSTIKQLTPPLQGALVISLDLELHWGVRDRRKLDRRERERLLLARTAALRIADLFEEFSVHATWAAVGFLFARSREDLERFIPSRRPRYDDPQLDPYREKTGRGESDDPFHFAPGLIDAIACRAGQEIATHSFSHFYCCESGQGPKEFLADLRSALAVADESGYRIRSYVFPRNQVNPRYLPLLKHAGILCFRGTQASAATEAGSFRFQQRPHRRLRRLGDNYFDLSGAQTIPWPSGPGPWSIGASRYLRPHNGFLSALDDLRYRRIVRAMESACACGELLHLWWHPEDFASDPDRNLQFLRRILEGWERLRRQSGMLSLSMSEVVQGINDSAGNVRAMAGTAF
jgi:peptidoglycan/xylan/chitin deacetylase (PgdA/CDA1 family)